MMHLSGTLTNEIHQHILGLGEHFSIGSHLRVAYRCIGIQCEYLDYAKTPESTGYARYANVALDTFNRFATQVRQALGLISKPQSLNSARLWHQACLRNE